MRILESMEVNWARIAGDAIARTWTREGRKMALSVSEMGFVLFDSALSLDQALLTRFFMYMAANNVKTTCLPIQDGGKATSKLYRYVIV